MKKPPPPRHHGPRIIGLEPPKQLSPEERLNTIEKLVLSILDDDVGKQTAVVLGDALTAFVATILPIIQERRGKLPEEVLARINDKAVLSFLAGFITHAVHPLARDVFMKHLAENVKIMGDAEWQRLTPQVKPPLSS